MPENMAVRWSSENVVAEYRDLQANAMAVDCTGKFSVLAGRKLLAIIDLDQPVSCIKKHPRQSKWEVGTAEWNPTPEKKDMFAITSNQRAELLICQEGDIVLQHVLRAHTRVISDLNWSPFDSNLIATCSVDTYVHLWDIRDSRRPAQSLCAIAGASQVKWNKARHDLLATAHDGDIRLWDHRKGSSPVQYIAAHLSKIHGLDWSPIQGQEYHLATSSQDCTVKFWDVTNPCRAQSVLPSSSPFWRARYTPFGDGLITVVVPQLRRGENSLLLWNASNLRAPVHTFVGHIDVVLEFEWRKHCEETKDYQLVTWSKDQSLRIWRIDSQLQKLCGHDTDLLDDLEQISTSGFDSLEMSSANGPVPASATQVVDSNSHVELHDHSSAPSLLMDDDEEMKFSVAFESEKVEDLEDGDAKNEMHSPIQPKNLQQEFVLLNRNIPNVRVEEVDINARTCFVSATYGKMKVRLLLTFPVSYPCNSPPTIQFCKGSSVSNNVKNELSKVLKTTCQQHVKKNLSCLEPCLRQLISTLHTCAVSEKESMDIGSPFTLDAPQTFLPPKMYGSYQDANVPFPRTSGATFCGAGLLVCFTRPLHMKGLPNGPDVTPRSLSALIAYAANPMQGHPGQTTPPFNLMYPPVAQSPTGDPSVSISAFYYQDRRQRARGKLRKDDAQYRNQKICSVAVYDISNLLPINKELAQAYVLDDSDIPVACMKNMAAAGAVGRKDLVQLWSLASLSASPTLKPSIDPNSGVPWASHPFGRKMIQSLIHHYLQLGDVQTVAMLCCTFSLHSNTQPVVKKQCSIPDTVTYTPGGSPYHTIHPGDTLLEGLNFGALLKSNRSNSWSDCSDNNYDNRHFSSIAQDPKDVERERHENNSRLLDPKQTLQYDEFKRTYAKILYQWGLLEARSQILKYISVAPEHHRGIEFLTECQHCRHDTRGPQCMQCKNYSFQCSICHVAVKGSFNFCMTCGHGGHTFHLMEWFKLHSTCPVGCGCNCLSESQPLEI